MQEESIQKSTPRSSARRKFIGQFGVTGGVALATGVIGIEPFLRTKRSQIEAAPAAGSNRRANDCAKLRRDAAQAGLQNTPQNLQHPPNGDESLTQTRLPTIQKDYRITTMAP